MTDSPTAAAAFRLRGGDGAVLPPQPRALRRPRHRPAVARVTIDQCRHRGLQTFKKQGASANIFSDINLRTFGDEILK
jgi:hypothetical protein